MWTFAEALANERIFFFWSDQSVEPCNSNGKNKIFGKRKLTFLTAIDSFLLFSTKICNEYDEYSLGKMKIMRSRNREYVNYVQRFIQLLKSLKNEDWMKWMDWRVAWHWRDSRGLYPISEQKQSSTGDFPTLFLANMNEGLMGFPQIFCQNWLGQSQKGHILCSSINSQHGLDWLWYFFFAAHCGHRLKNNFSHILCKAF